MLGKHVRRPSEERTAMTKRLDHARGHLERNSRQSVAAVVTSTLCGHSFKLPIRKVQAAEDPRPTDSWYRDWTERFGLDLGWRNSNWKSGGAIGESWRHLASVHDRPRM